MADKDKTHWIVPTKGATTLPVIEILTGRGFITGKSGSGKSNSAGVIAEELLDNGYNLLVVDPEGEYYGLKEKYEVLHVGNDDICDVQVTAEHADELATIALERNMPIILDVSGYLDGDAARELIASTVRELFRKEKKAQKPFLLVVEEMQEYLPQSGGTDELSELLERVAKRGRKRGLGMLGISQRPSSVDKDFITQCDWMIWHRLTWQNDIDVVRNILGSDIASQIEDLDTGEGYLMTDWDESVECVQFKRKKTHDAGATPGLESYDRPDLNSVSKDLIRDIKTGDVSADPDTAVEASSEVPAQSEGESSTIETTESPDSSNLDEMVSEDGDTTTGGDPADLNSLSDDELRERVESLRRRNQNLEAQVAELQSSNRTSAREPHERTPQTVSKPPQKPVPPDPPAQRSGFSGNLVELVHLFGYLLRSITYRVRSFLHRIRYSD
ncbi:ATP-binding protein [Halovenus marina]|uniref:ATP-binding protein n=1 Tax=Halovenus marina TaxID=3396621 RepID=UPI003F55293B